MPDMSELDRLLASAGRKPHAAEPEVEMEDAPVDLGPCASRPTAKFWPGFHVKNATQISKKEPNRRTTRSFDFSHMGYREFLDGGTEFIMEIQEPEKWRVRVEGRALWRIYSYLHQHRLEWVEPVRGNAAMAVPDGVPCIERITIERIEEGE